ncbi:hypothetical protein K4K60_009011 [Colletotrichum sp. SAR11_57]|nr:hypothetical protein K4K60_009011 [Colletotrichum sp. SAR11_57]
MDLMICGTCGVQFDSHAVKSCKICDDPRQYVAEDGQWFTTLRELQDSKKYTNTFTKDKFNSAVIAIRTEPQLAIGQRAFLLRSPGGNVLWDCITYIDADTVRRVKALGGLDAIVISHPHYFSTALHWAEAFGCKVYVSAEDGEWLTRRGKAHELWEAKTMEFVGGEFLVVKIPLSPDDVHGIWKAISALDFEDAHSAFPGRDARGGAKKRLLESAQLCVKFMGYANHAIHSEKI